jgi:hypothetical protein
MRRAGAVHGLIVWVVMVAGCGMTAAEADPSARVSPPQTTEPNPLGFGERCGSQIERCRWAIASCTGDPACAHWYACVRGCDTTNLDGCRASCDADAGAKNENSQRLATENCLFPAAGLPQCGTAGGKSGQPDEAAQDASSPDFGSAGAGGEGIGGPLDAVAGPQECYTCFNDHCASYCVRWGEQASVCGGYTGAIKKCLSSEAGPDHLEECLYNARESNAQAYGAFVNSSAMKCVYGECSQSCFGPNFNRCLQCERSSCLDELNAVLTDLDAQNYVWCRAYCASNAEGCTSSCEDQYSDGALVAEGLLRCRLGACAASCG